MNAWGSGMGGYRDEMDVHTCGSMNQCTCMCIYGMDGMINTYACLHVQVL